MQICRFAVFAAIGLSIAACAPIPGRTAMTATACERELQLPGTGSPRLLVFGEMHGSVEAPEYFEMAVCAALRNGARREVVAVLELPMREEAALQRYLRSEGSDDDRDRLLATPFWSNRDWQDGRASVAMFELVETLRVLARSNPGLAVATLVPDDDGHGSHDARMARRLDAIAEQHADALILVLVGNLHARRMPGSPFDPEFRSMVYLSEQPSLSYGFRVRGGRIWACMASGCGVHEMPENPQAGDPIFDLRLTPPSEHYDGLIDLGEYTASPPAWRQFASISADSDP